jgi:hypothetical protein
MWDFVMDKSGPGAGFLRELLFPLPIYIPSASPQSSSLSPEAGTIGQELPQCHSLTKKCDFLEGHGLFRLLSFLLRLIFDPGYFASCYLYIYGVISKKNLCSNSFILAST